MSSWFLHNLLVFIKLSLQVVEFWKFRAFLKLSEHFLLLLKLFVPFLNEYICLVPSDCENMIFMTLVPHRTQGRFIHLFVGLNFWIYILYIYSRCAIVSSINFSWREHISWPHSWLLQVIMMFLWAKWRVHCRQKLREVCTNIILSWVLGPMTSLSLVSALTP